MNALAIPSTDQKITVVNQEHGAFTVTPQSQDRIHVTSTQGIVIDGLLYWFTGTMVRHPSGWRFDAQELDIPKLPAKQKLPVIEQLTHQINAYMDEHPEIMRALEHKHWTDQRDRLLRSVRDQQARLVQKTTWIEQEQEAIKKGHEYLAELQQSLAEHEAKRPEDLPDDEDVED